MVLPGKRRQKPHPLVIFQPCSRLPVPRDRLRKVAAGIFKKENVPVARRISLVFCSDYFIRKLNARYRNIDRATDVLSFATGDADLLGEIYISLERAKVQARRYKTSTEDEIIRLFVHGFFHLLGYDHHKPGERKTMENKEAFYR
jgi:probable rRNA maturation factor